MFWSWLSSDQPQIQCNWSPNLASIVAHILAHIGRASWANRTKITHVWSLNTVWINLYSTKPTSECTWIQTCVWSPNSTSITTPACPKPPLLLCSSALLPLVNARGNPGVFWAWPFTRPARGHVPALTGTGKRRVYPWDDPQYDKTSKTVKIGQKQPKTVLCASFPA